MRASCSESQASRSVARAAVMSAGWGVAGGPAEEGASLRRGPLSAGRDSAEAETLLYSCEVSPGRARLARARAPRAPFAELPPADQRAGLKGVDGFFDSHAAPRRTAKPTTRAKRKAS